MKLFHFHFGKDGGAERFFVNLVNALQERGVEQTAFIRPDRKWRPEIDSRIELHEGVWRRLSLSRFFLEAKLKRLLKEHRPDGLMGWMPRGARFTPAWPHCLKIARLGDYPPHLDYFRNSDVLVCNSPDIGRRVQKLGWKRRVEIISNFTSIQQEPPIDRASVNTPSNAFVVLGIGRLVRRKGFHTLIEAIKGLPNAYLWLVGEGEEQEKLENSAKELRVVDRCRFLGWRQNPAPFFAASDVFCLPSIHEPLGNVILEAWSSSKPVVSSQSEGPTWMIRNGVDGLLFSIGDVQGLTLALRRLQANPALAAALVCGGRKTLETRFSEQSVCDSYINLFKRGLPKD